MNNIQKETLKNFLVKGCSGLQSKPCGLCAGGWDGTRFTDETMTDLVIRAQGWQPAKIEAVKKRLCGPQTSRFEQGQNELNQL